MGKICRSYILGVSEVNRPILLLLSCKNIGAKGAIKNKLSTPVKFFSLVLR